MTDAEAPGPLTLLTNLQNRRPARRDRRPRARAARLRDASAATSNGPADTTGDCSGSFTWPPTTPSKPAPSHGTITTASDLRATTFPSGPPPGAPAPQRPVGHATRQHQLPTRITSRRLTISLRLTMTLWRANHGVHSHISHKSWIIGSDLGSAPRLVDTWGLQ